MKTGVCKKRCRTTYFEFQIGEKCNYDVAEVPRYKDKIDICVKIYNYLMASVGSEWDYENYYLFTAAGDAGVLSLCHRRRYR